MRPSSVRTSVPSRAPTSVRPREPVRREMPARRVVVELLRTASREAFQVAVSYAARPPVSTMLKPATTKPLHHDHR
ncbi:hypothetical protein D1007_62146 [Hordeum vulgare]|nr:hypothetical protein D1007_62146 [Hordeum vulgare]